MSLGMNFEYTLNSDNVVQSIANMPTANAKEKSLIDFFVALKDQVYFETGLLPLDGSGTLSIRQALGHMQVVFQHAPGLYRVIWGNSEGDPEAHTYDLAMPYRIVIGDFVDGEFYGARHFYSVEPITSKEQILFHVNLPNLNCKGYGAKVNGIGNGVGWICLYHNKPSIKDLNVGQKIANLIDRAGGGEAYNDANMNETDGPRFYEEQYFKEITSDPSLNIYDFEYLWDPSAWEEKSSSDGFGWTLDPSLWIPVRVKGIDSQDRHCDAPDADFLTVGMAMDGKYRAYYHDAMFPKAYQKISRPDLENPDSKDITAGLTKAFNAAVPLQVSTEKPVSNPIIPINTGFYCIECKKNYDEKSFHVESSDGVVCEICLHDYYELCLSCDIHHHYSQLYYYKDNFHCQKCLELIHCPECSLLMPSIDIEEKNRCPQCNFVSEEDFSTLTQMIADVFSTP